MTKPQHIKELGRIFEGELKKSTFLQVKGMTFCTNKENIFGANLEPKIKLFEKCLKQWQHRKLTLMGKITVIKKLCTSKISICSFFFT